MVESKYKKHFVWGAINGLLLGILLVSKIDISEGGIAAMILDSLKPLLIESGIPTLWISIIIIFIGILGLVSLGLEIKDIYDAGKMAITFAILGFIGMFLLILEIDFGIWFLITAGILFATEQYWGK